MMFDTRACFFFTSFLLSCGLSGSENGPGRVWFETLLGAAGQKGQKRRYLITRDGGHNTRNHISGICKQPPLPDTYTFGNVGFGDTFILRLGGRIVVVDCWQSGEYGWYTGESPDSLVDLLPERRVDCLILTHRHYDHYYGISQLLENDIQVQEVWESPWQRKPADTSIDEYQWNRCGQLVEDLANRGSRVRTAHESDFPFVEVEGYTFRALNPTKDLCSDPGSTLHDGCLVVQVCSPIEMSELLFCGDASLRALRGALSRGRIGQTRILCCSHHGALDSLDQQMLEIVAPGYTVISSQPGVCPPIPENESQEIYARHSHKRLIRTWVDGRVSLEASRAA